MGSLSSSTPCPLPCRDCICNFNSSLLFVDFDDDEDNNFVVSLDETEETEHTAKYGDDAPFSPEYCRKVEEVE